MIILSKMNYMFMVIATVFVQSKAQIVETLPEPKIQHAVTQNSFVISDINYCAPIVIDPKDADVVRIAANELANDIFQVSGESPVVLTSLETVSDNPIIIGTVGQSSIIDQLIRDGKIPADKIVSRWESFIIANIDNPAPKMKRALVIAGSDRRGTAFGVFELSRRIGVSPWIWWADVTPKQQTTLAVSSGIYISSEPSVTYRGIFLNDEGWGLQPWAAANIDQDVNDIGPRTYAKIFELLLRHKANFIWPAMHPCTKAFYYYPENAKMADQYAIVIGSSHCEPMLRNNVDEWSKNFQKEYGRKPGPWNFKTNRDTILRYWEDRVKQTIHSDVVYTMGKRGIHDSGMPGYKTLQEKTDALSEVILSQRDMLARNSGRPVSSVPQIFCPYKEALRLYQNGADIPEDITLVWADDNHGYIRQLSTPDEQNRSGGSGVYYHISYWGSPADYLWLSSTSPALISYEMNKAHAYGADRLWVLNVGDIKPAETEISYFLDLAYDITNHPPEKAIKWLREWAAFTFGEDYATDIAEIKRKYYELCHGARPEHIDIPKWSPEDQLARAKAWAELSGKSESVREKIPTYLQDAYFQLIHYPVSAAGAMNRKFLLADYSLTIKDNPELAREFAQDANDAFELIADLTRQYNQLNNGKWNKMMDATPRAGGSNKHRSDVLFTMPPTATAPVSSQRTDEVSPAYRGFISRPMISSFAPVQIPAAKFQDQHPSPTGEIRVIPGLGFTGGGISAMPFTMPKSSIEEAPAVSYEVALPAGGYQITVRVLPTQRINKERPYLRYAIALDNQAFQTVDAKTPDGSEIWKVNVIRGFHETQTVHTSFEPVSSLTLKILDPGLVINQILIQPVTPTYP